MAAVEAGAATSEEAEAAPDLRLAFVAAGIWAAVIAVLYLGVGWGIGIAVVGVAGVLAGARANRAWLGVLGAVAIGVTAGAVVASAQVALRDAAPFQTWVEEGRVVTTRVVMTDDALRLRSGQRPTYRVPVRVERVRGGDNTVMVSARVVVFATDAGRWHWERVLPGQQLTVRGRLSPAQPGTLNTADLAVGKAPKVHGQPPWWQRAAGSLRAGLRQACEGLPSEPGGLLPGLALGDVSTMDSGVDGDFRDAGMTHLLAVSGSNVAIVVGAVVLLATGCGAGRRTRVVLGVVVIIGFVVLVRPSPSVLRAAVMGGLGLLVLSRRGSRDAVPILAAAVAVLLLVDPGLATNLGFVLSVVATAGLVFFATRWSRALQARGWPLWLAAAVAVPAAAQLAVTPVLAAATGAITPVAVVANALAAIAVAPATVLAVAATVVWPLWPDAAVALTWLASWPARWLVAVADHAAQVPSGSLPWPEGVLPGLLLALIIAASLLLLRWRAGRRFLVVVVLGVVVGVVPVRLLSGGWPPPGWVLIACDVGQGDALLLPTGVDSRVIVIDTGPDPRAIDTCLRSLGVERVALLVFTHAHADHIGGVTGVYSGRTVEAVLPPLPDGLEPPGTAAPDHGGQTGPDGNGRRGVGQTATGGPAEAGHVDQGEGTVSRISGRDEPFDEGVGGPVGLDGAGCHGVGQAIPGDPRCTGQSEGTTSGSDAAGRHGVGQTATGGPTEQGHVDQGEGTASGPDDDGRCRVGPAEKGGPNGSEGHFGDGTRGGLDGSGRCGLGQAGPGGASGGDEPLGERTAGRFGAGGGPRVDGVASGRVGPLLPVGYDEGDGSHGWDGSGRQRLDEAVRETPALSVAAGDSLSVGATRLEVLAPDSEFTGTRSDPNNNSHVLRATVGGISILLSGDVEEPAQASLLASGQGLGADVLKVPHHGSGYFDTGFFEAVAPRLAVVSAGRGNDYGHPHPRALRQLERQGAAVFRTDRDGGFAVVAEDGRLAVMTMD